MADYISRDSVLRSLCYSSTPVIADNGKPTFQVDYIKAVNSITAADVRPVVRGKWTRVNYEPCGHDYICSVCGCKSDGAWNFCHDCGADMRAERTADNA